MTQRCHTACMPSSCLASPMAMPRCRGLLRSRARTSAGTHRAAREGPRHLAGHHLGGVLRQVRAIGAWPDAHRPRPRRPLVIASEGTPEWFYADLGGADRSAASVGIYPDQPVAGTAVHRAPLPAPAWPSAATRSRPTRCSMPCANGGACRTCEHIICVDMKGMRHYQEPCCCAFEDAVGAGRTTRRGRRGPSAAAGRRDRPRCEPTT